MTIKAEDIRDIFSYEVGIAADRVFHLKNTNIFLISS